MSKKNDYIFKNNNKKFILLLILQKCHKNVKK